MDNTEMPPTRNWRSSLKRGTPNHALEPTAASGASRAGGALVAPLLGGGSARTLCRRRRPAL